MIAAFDKSNKEAKQSEKNAKLAANLEKEKAKDVKDK